MDKFLLRRIWKPSTYLLLFLLCALLFGGCARSPEARRTKHLAEGKEFFEKKDYARALLEFKNAAQAVPADPEAYYQLGLTYAVLGEVRGAVFNFRIALERNPKHAGAQLKLAQLMAATSDPDLLKDAQSRLTGLLQDNSAKDPEILTTLALTELKMGKTDTAIQDFERVLAESPQQLSSSVMLAQARLSKGDAKGAEEVLKEACESSPKSADPLVMLGRFHRSQGRLPEAEATLQHALAVDPKSEPAMMYLAMVQYSLGRKQEAEVHLRRLANSTAPNYRPVLGLFLFQEGRRAEAVAEFERLVKQDPDDRPTRTRLVAAYQAMNRTADSKKLLDS